MFHIIAHQVFWTLFAFIIFHLLMQKFVFSKINNVFHIRKVKEQGFLNVIEAIKMDNNVLEAQIEMILKIDILNKENSYINSYLEKEKTNLDLEIKKYDSCFASLKNYKVEQNVSIKEIELFSEKILEKLENL